ncbi:hypothetical protein DY000_02008942 [Brassica cretica]|uniref:Uncharacterized protein n=1 Tax=Brassica cretica TaxID=69181 RepID=A0ABQ7BZ50_BRACR|nr:hypothetical protein DY000_02008942 [Brassica cretica]
MGVLCCFTSVFLVDALQQIATTLGSKYWKFDAESCTVEKVGLTETPPPSAEQVIECECSPTNETDCHVVKIAFKDHNLPGTLPPEITKLPKLREIDFALNYLNGTIPLEWFTTNLTIISLLVNRLSGEIPKELGNLTSLTFLYVADQFEKLLCTFSNLESNAFSGTIPQELGNLVKTLFQLIQWLLFTFFSILLFIDLFSYLMSPSKSFSQKKKTKKFIPMEPTGDSPDSSDRKTGKKIIASSATVKPNGKSIASSAIVKTVVSSTIPVKPNVATALSSAHANQVMFFRDVSFGPCEVELRFRLIHFWEARNPLTKTLIGQEMLLINEEGTAIQGFVPSGRVGTFDLTDGVVYKLSNFFGSRSKVQYRRIGSGSTGMRSLRPTVALRVTFMWTNDEALHMGQGCIRLLPEIQILWRHPSVLLVTTVNPKHIGGTLALTTMSSSRVFMDADVQPSKDYLEWLSSNSDIANRVAAEAVKGPTSLICNSKKCGKREVTGVAQYLTKISVYDESEQAVFVVLGDAGKELTGKHASELVASYFETLSTIFSRPSSRDSNRCPSQEWITHLPKKS